MSLRSARTATTETSIWRNTPEDEFRKHLVDLEKRTNAVPIDMQTFPIKNWLDRSVCDAHTLPLDIEQQLADDFAFLSAVEEGAQSVAAACIEENIHPPGLTLRFAALDMSVNDTTKSALRNISALIQQAAVDHSFRIEMLFRQVVQLHFPRLLARLRSVKWQKPKYLSKSHKKPLWQDFTNLAHRVQFIYTKKEYLAKQLLEARITVLASLYESFELTPAASLEEETHMKTIIQKSYDFCMDDEVKRFAQRLQTSISGTPTKQVGAAVKTLRQLEKIAAYWRISFSMVGLAKTYPSIFHNGITTEYLAPYKSIPTTIGYESWAKTCHVHAEVQLAVHYDLLSAEEQTRFHRPRAVGTSKYLCYLCYQFLRAHKRFFPSNTHGRLYDQWTIPDLADLGENHLEQYRSIVKAIDDEVVRSIDATHTPESRESHSVRWRAEPMTSQQNLLGMGGPKQVDGP